MVGLSDFLKTRIDVILRSEATKNLVPRTLSSLQPKIILALILIFLLGLRVTLSLDLPLGESSDELAHFRYIQFIADHGRPPINQHERQEVGYRSKWPPLYQSFVAPLVYLTESDGPKELKTIGSNPRRLLPLDGFGGMSFLHTDDEAFPFKGAVRSWHVTRLASAVLSVGTLWLIFLTLRKQFSVSLSLAVIVVIGLIPTLVTIGAVLSDDNLLGFLLALYLWLLWPLFHRPATWRRYFMLGLVAGLALVTKFSTALLPLSLVLVHVLSRRRISRRSKIIGQFGAFIGGYCLTAAWWFVFVIYYFNQIQTFGWLRGILAPFLSGGSDLTTRRMAAMLGLDSVLLSSLEVFSIDWWGWLQSMLVTFWFPEPEVVKSWFWPPILAMILSLIVGLILVIRQSPGQGLQRKIILFFAGYTLLFIPLPIIRFVFTQNIAETAQGRHILFPVLLPLAWLMIVGLRHWLSERGAIAALLGLGCFFFITLVGVIWPVITLADSPYLPVRTSLEAEPDIRLDVSYAQEVKLIGLDQAEATEPYAIPLTLIWQAKKAPAVDYSLRLALLDQTQNEVGLWWGQPVNGRYPTRAWEEGDVVYDTIWLPFLPELSPGMYALSIQLLDEHGQPVPNDADGESILTVNDIVISDTNVEAPVRGTQVRLIPRGDRFKTIDPYRYRSTVAMLLTGPASAEIIALASPDDKLYKPLARLAGQGGIILLFTVDWRWASGEYDLVILDVEDPGSEAKIPPSGELGGGQRSDRDAGRPRQTFAEIVAIFNNHRLTEPPPISRPVNANFDNQFVLLGYDLPVNRVEPGQSFEITLYWRSLQMTNTSYKVFNHLLDSTQTQYGGRDRIPQGFYSTVLWKPGEVVVDRYNVPVFPDAPDGIYWLDIGLYPAGDITAPPLPLVEGERVLAANSVLLGPVKVGGQPALSIPSSPPQQSQQAHFGDVIRLEGYSLALDVDQRRLNLELYWSPVARPALDYTVFIHVVNQSGQVTAQGDGQPLAGLYPTSFWEVGEQIFDRRQISLPGLPPGLYQIRLGWYDAASGQRLSVADNPEGFIILDEFHLN